MSKRVLVTGASKGIGKATAVALAAEGYNVIVHYRSDISGAEATVAAITEQGGRAELLCCDVSDREECRAVIGENIESMGPFYGVVHSAGVCKDVVFPAMEGEDWDAVIRTDLDSFYNVIHPCVMPMIQARQGGRIVTLASVSGIMGNRGQVNYSAAKAGIIGATKALAVELAKRNITVNCVAPGLIETDMIADVEFLDEAIKHIPMRRVGDPSEVASLICYLLSDMAGYITRQVISVNGGLI